jgi:Na+-translocating ferredoxin:NAD+ oxidoreductase RNF subunit RnfB
MLKIIPELCDGKMHCLRICPTQAIRIRNGKAINIEERCVDCGRCLQVCPHQAIAPQTDAWVQLEKLKYRVAVPSPALLGQFPREYSPEEILQALSRIGFQEAVDITQYCDWVSWAIREFILSYRGPKPLISSFCPAIVRLIQIRYPSLINQLIPLKGPEVIAVEALRQKRSNGQMKGPKDFNAIYLTPCPAMVTQGENDPDHQTISGAVSIRDLYNPLLAFLNQQPDAYRWPMPTMGTGLRWARLGGSGSALREQSWITVSGLYEIVRVLDDIESGKLKDTDYAECWSCRGGCIGGPLTVENYYMAYHKVILLEQRKIHTSPLEVDQLRKLYHQGFFHLEERQKPKSYSGPEVNLIEALARRRVKEQALALFPMINCGVCGAPDCNTLAEDISRGQAEVSDCIFHGQAHLEELKRIYKVPAEGDKE